MPKVSIVLPTYNGERFLKSAIESVLNQTFKDWELIIVNDCSTDCTPKIIEEYLKLDNRIHVINNEVNKKLPAALNIGFREATGEYFTWTSDDNMYHADAVEKMVLYLENNKRQQMVCTRLEVISADGSYQQISEPYEDVMMLLENRVGACFLYRRNVLDEVGEYDMDMFLVEDYEYWLRIFFRYGSIGFINEVLYTYRNHSNSLTATRYMDIQRKNARMKAKYIKEIVGNLAEKPEHICRIYFYIKFFYGISESDKKIFTNYLDVLDIVVEKEIPDKCIVYGAGKIGGLFYKKYPQKVLFFADKNISKVGGEYCKKEIISLEKMAQLADEYDVVVAAGIEKIYDFLKTLQALGVKKSIIYQDEW